MSVLAKLLPKRRATANLDPELALRAAAEWLSRAQDATDSGGVSAHYDASKCKWVGAYPETTGYIIPTFFRYAEFCGEAVYRERAVRMAEWESDIQLPDGGVRAGTMDAAQVVPTIFNTGQVLFGWTAAWQQTRQERFRDSLIRAADWLEAAQDEEMAGIAEEILRVGAARHVGFRQRGPSSAQDDGAEACEHPEAGAPACVLFEEAAENRGDHRGHDKGHGDVGNHAGGLFAGEDIAHHGAG